MQFLPEVAIAGTCIFLVFLSIAITVPRGGRKTYETIDEPTVQSVIQLKSKKPQVSAEKCQKSSDCRPHEVCKGDNEFGFYCVASMDLRSCDGVHCEAPERCELVYTHPKCRCPSNALLIVTETVGTPERRCRNSCGNTNFCKPGTLCFEDFQFNRYCEDIDRIAECSDAVKCSFNTECRLTIDQLIECLCKNHRESTDIESTESGSMRTCKTSTCEDSGGCPRTELCSKDKYSKQGFCQARGRECPAEVVCDDITTCKLNSDGFAECLCINGYTEIENAGLWANTRTCHIQTCENSNGCGKGELCYQDEISLELYCADNSRGCYRAVCPDMTECLDTLLGYAECFCTKGYNEMIETTTDDMPTTMRTCEEKICGSSNDCKVGYLCYTDAPTDPSSICSTRLKGCDGVKCPSEAGFCREIPSGFAECLCGQTEYTAVYETDSQGTIRACHNTQTKCIPEVVCGEGYHCDDSGPVPQCICNDGQATEVLKMGDILTGKISDRICYPSCTDTDNCYPGFICYSGTAFIGHACIDDRRPGRNKCSKVTCSPGTECSDEYEIADCLCPNDAPTIINMTATGSERVCNDDYVSCNDSRICSELITKTTCYRDPYSLQSQCLDPLEIDSCDDVKCSNNSFCDATSKTCGCLRDEVYRHGTCWKTCTDDQECEDDTLGNCREDGICLKERTKNAVHD